MKDYKVQNIILSIIFAMLLIFSICFTSYINIRTFHVLYYQGIELNSLHSNVERKLKKEINDLKNNKVKESNKINDVNENSLNVKEEENE